MNPFDHSLFELLNQFAGHHLILDTFMKLFTEYSPEIYAALFILAWFTLPKDDSKHRHALVVSVLSGVLALLINVVIAHIWFRPRPFAVLPKNDVTQLVPHPSDASFPSDHSSGSFGFASALWGKGPRWLSITFTIVAILVMISRVYDGLHWPTDVLAGLAVGVFSSRIMWKCSRFFYPLTSLGLRLFQFGEYSRRQLKQPNGRNLYR